jgi:predicted nuclease of predicted toxin-antitoxin system
VKLLVDANLSPRVADLLRAGGHTVSHVIDVGLATAEDTKIAAWAAENGHCIVSSDSDFSAILARTGAVSPSFVLLRHLNELNPDQQAELLLANLQQVADYLAAGAVVTFARDRIRVRSLPFRAGPLP